jgi:hypothetical protein
MLFAKAIWLSLFCSHQATTLPEKPTHLKAQAFRLNHCQAVGLKAKRYLAPATMSFNLRPHRFIASQKPKKTGRHF